MQSGHSMEREAGPWAVVMPLTLAPLDCLSGRGGGLVPKWLWRHLDVHYSRCVGERVAGELEQPCENGSGSFHSLGSHWEISPFTWGIWNGASMYV